MTDNPGYTVDFIKSDTDHPPRRGQEAPAPGQGGEAS